MTYDYHEPREVAEALHLLVKHGEDAHLIAGGTATVLLLRQGLIRPGHVISLRAIGALSGIGRAPDGGLRIGATATHRQAERSADVRALSPALTNAFASVATVRIRNQATVGGSLAHADPAQDPPPMLAALGAAVTIVSPRGARSIAVEDLAVDHFTTTLAGDEIITEVIVPPLAPGTRATYVKFLPRTADDYATVSVAAAMRLADGAVADARIVLGAVGPTPIRARAAEAALAGAKPSRERLAQAAALVRDEVDPLDDLRGSAEYKREMARVWTERALLALVEA
ncbi:MAG: xanthine dehydrogenase family protein subunit M [Chloroflexi bacterium]|nr:MAG: xanthine dehydrogenase family protein subunit M [Chloroflexota bacterium]